MIGSGRQDITIPYRTITDANVIDALQRSLPKFRTNAQECQFLMDYKNGVQPIKRTSPKRVMEWIDFQNVDNVAKEVSDFWKAFNWGNPITLVLRGEVDDEDGRKAEGMKYLNNCYSALGSTKDLQRLAEFIEITGIAYSLVNINTEWEEGESCFTRDILDPRSAFVVRSSYYTDRRVMMGVTLCKDEDETEYVTVYTKDAQYDIIGDKIVNKIDNTSTRRYRHTRESNIANPLGKVNVCEWVRSVDRTGVFEAQINACDNLNLLSSDISNGVDQGIQSFFWTNDVELQKKLVTYEDGSTEEVTVKPGAGEWLHTFTGQNGNKPSIQPLALDYHLSEIQSNYLSQRALILQKCHVPQRNANSGSSSGLAMDTAQGWVDAEAVAGAQECLTIGCQLEEIKVVLAAIRESVGITDVTPDNPMLVLTANDIDICIRRPKNYELTTRVNAFCALVAKGASVEDALAAAPIAFDPAQFIARSGEGIIRYQEANVWNIAEETDDSRPFADNSDEHDRSPLIDSIETGKGEIDDA